MFEPQKAKYSVEDFHSDVDTSDHTVYKILTDLPKSKSSIDNAFIGALQILLRDIDLAYLSQSFKNVSLGRFLTLTESELRNCHLLTVDINRIEEFLKSFHLKRWNVRSTLNLDGWNVKMDSEEILLAMIRIVQQLYIDRMSIIYVMNHLQELTEENLTQDSKACDVSDDTKRAMRALCKISQKLAVVIKRINLQTEDPVWSLGPCDLITKESDKKKCYRTIFLRMILPSLLVGMIVWRWNGKFLR